MNKVQEDEILGDENYEPTYIVYDCETEKRFMIGLVFKSEQKQYVYEIELENLEELPTLTPESLTQTIYSQHQFLTQTGNNDKMTEQFNKASGAIIQAIQLKKSKLANNSEGSAQKVR